MPGGFTPPVQIKSEGPPRGLRRVGSKPAARQFGAGIFQGGAVGRALEAWPPAAWFFGCKEPWKKQLGLRPQTPGAQRRCYLGDRQDLKALRARFGLWSLKVGLPGLRWLRPKSSRCPPGHLDPAAHHPPRLKVVAFHGVPKKTPVLPCLFSSSLAIYSVVPISRYTFESQ